MHSVYLPTLHSGFGTFQFGSIFVCKQIWEEFSVWNNLTGTLQSCQAYPKLMGCFCQDDFACSIPNIRKTLKWGTQLWAFLKGPCKSKPFALTFPLLVGHPTFESLLWKKNKRYLGQWLSQIPCRSKQGVRAINNHKRVFLVLPEERDSKNVSITLSRCWKQLRKI